MARKIAENLAEQEKMLNKDEKSDLEAWEAQEPCSYCGARAGQNPLTGIWVRSWDQATKKFIEGHRMGCLRPLLKK